MTFSATYDDTEELGRVRLTFSGYAAYADYASVERSTDGITWVQVRGGAQTPLLSGAGHLDDYEFTPGVLNTYRVSSINAEDPSIFASGTAVSGNNSSVTPSVPAGMQKGDVEVLHASIRNSGAGTVNVPAGWTAVSNTGNQLVAVRDWASGHTGPTVTFSGGVANADTLAYIVPVRNVSVTPFHVNDVLNSSAQDITSPATVYPAGGYTLRLGWKQDDYTTFTLPGWTPASGVSSTAGDDACQVSFGLLRPTAGSETLRVLQIIGGAAAISRGVVVSFSKRSFIDQETATVTPGVQRFRIKNPQRPALNKYIEPLPLDTPITRPSRTGVFDVIGRTLPVVVSDVQGSRRFTLRIDVFGYAQKDAMDQVLATGEPMYLETPAGASQLPRLYFVAGDVEVQEDANGTASYTFSIPVIECASPAASVAGETYTYADVLADFATYADVLAGVATYSALLDKVSDSEVVVP